MVFDKYLYALGRGVRGVRQALGETAEPERGAVADPAEAARDVTPPRPAPAGPGVLPDLGRRPLVMGIVNVTPDSFSDGGRWLDHDAALAHALELVDEGADILDIGGESTRPGAQAVEAGEERDRVVPVIRALAQRTKLPISVDTMKASVAAAASDAGAAILNDVWGFQRDPDMARIAAANGCYCVLMHNRTVDDPAIDMFAEVKDFLQRSVEIALRAGVAHERIIVDPGFGFGKTHPQGFELLRRLDELKAALGLPLLLGVSRKRFIGAASGVGVASERVSGSVAAALWGVLHGADIVRVHDVRAHVEALGVLEAITTATERGA